ncbi:MAG TPA: hypothetical protein VFB59_00170, partial [Candidatus Saccharimonadales bacterium]|nr:hypothetical protein [Candidatus Saccharimonadales bacterium]
MRLERLRNFVADMWQPLLLYGGLFVALGSLLIFRLGTLLPGYATQEVTMFNNSDNAKDILQDPLGAPFTLITHGLTYLTSHSYLLTRVTAALFGLATLVAFCWLLQH